MADESIGALVVRIEANLQNFESNMGKMSDKFDDIGKKADGFGGKVGSAFGGIAKAAVALGAVAGVGAFFKSTIGDAAEAESNLQQLEAVLQSTAGKAGVTKDAATGLASALQKVTKFSDDQVLAGENLLLTFTSIGKDVFPAATETMLDMSQALGQDVKGSAIQLGKALNDPINGVTALRKVGVQFTDSQEALIKKMVESGDVMGAQKLILAELGTEFGGSARKAAEGAGVWARIANQFGEVKEAIGGALLPTLEKIGEWFLTKLPELQTTVSTAFTSIGNFIRPIYETVMPLLRQGFQYFSENIVPIFSGVLKNLTETVIPPLQRIFEVIIKDVLPKLAESFKFWVENIYPIFAEAFNYIVSNILPPVIKIIEFIATEIIPMLAAKFQEWIPVIADIMRGLWDIIKIVLDKLIAAFKFVWPYIQDQVMNAINVITSVIGGLLRVLRGVIDFVAGVFTGDWARAWGGVRDIFGGIWDGLKGIAKGALNGLIAIVNMGIRALNRLRINVPDWLTELTGIQDFSLNIPQIPYLAKGTNFVPFDTQAFIHKGEAVIPADNNPSNPNAKNPIGGGSINYDGMFRGAIFNVRSDQDAKLIARELYNLQKSRARGSGAVAT